MNTKVILPVPLDNWPTFDPFIHRFLDTYKQYNAGIDHELIAVLNHDSPNDYVRKLFEGTNARFHRYDGYGWNLGSAQSALSICFDTDFIVSMSSRCYFHRDGWLQRLVSARMSYGSGIYGTGSYEAKRHIRLCAFGIDARLFRAHPGQVTSADLGHRMEYKDWCLTDFVEAQGGRAMQVTFSGEQESGNWRTPDNIYRRGNQTNVLVFDKWTDDYRNLDAAGKLDRETRTDGPERIK